MYYRTKLYALWHVIVFSIQVTAVDCGALIDEDDSRGGKFSNKSALIQASDDSHSDINSYLI